MQSNSLILNNLTIGYKKMPVLSAVSAAIEGSQLVLLCGKNGSGKSTLMKSMLGLLKPMSGEIKINGFAPYPMSIAKKAALVSYVAAKPVNINNITVREIAETGRAPYTSWNHSMSPTDNKIVEQSLEYLQIEHIQYKNIDEVSDGERQKTMIARALAQDTPYLLLDEPTAFLDYPSKTELIRILIRLSKEFSKTVVLTSHDLDLLIPVSDRLWFCNNGEVISGSSADLHKNPSFRLFYDKTL